MYPNDTMASGLNYEAKVNSVTGSVFNLSLWRSLFLVKLQAFYYKWQWQSLWWSLFLVKLEAFPINMKAYYKWSWRSLCRSLFLVKLQAFIRNVSNRAWDWVYFYQRFRDLLDLTVMKSLTESVFSCRLWQTLFLVKFHIFAINGRERVCDGVCI